MGFAQDGDYVDDILQVVRTDVNYEYAPDWNFHWAASYRQAEQNFDHFYFGNYCGLDGKTQRMRLVQKKKKKVTSTKFTTGNKPATRPQPIHSILKESSRQASLNTKLWSVQTGLMNNENHV